jgi:DNA (cytosine-5)-methyltransferase 1
VNLVLSIFPGVDLLGMGFELEGYCVVRGPDTIWGGDIRTFHPTRGVFRGMIGGSPCQEFSRLLRTEPTGYSVEMLLHYTRCVTEAEPEWFLLENVPGVPDVVVPGYHVQRFNVRASEFGGRQHRLRAMQFGSRDGTSLVLRRRVTRPVATAPAALASEGRRAARRGWAEFCALQGLEEPLELPGLSRRGEVSGGWKRRLHSAGS